MNARQLVKEGMIQAMRVMDDPDQSAAMVHQLINQYGRALVDQVTASFSAPVGCAGGGIACEGDVLGLYGGDYVDAYCEYAGGGGDFGGVVVGGACIDGKFVGEGVASDVVAGGGDRDDGECDGSVSELLLQSAFGADDRAVIDGVVFGEFWGESVAGDIMAIGVLMNSGGVGLKFCEGIEAVIGNGYSEVSLF
jgi:hypothetical protein